MERPYKDSAKQGDRIHSLVCLSAEVQWVNEANGGVISRAGLSSFRVTTVHVHNDEKRSVESCKLALKTLFWLALRDKHRVVAGDFNLEPQAIRDAVDCVIEQFEGASYEVLHGDRSAEICCVLLNFAKLPQLRGAVKSAVAERWTSEELRLSDNDADSHYPLILELPLWSCVRVTCVSDPRKRLPSERRRSRNDRGRKIAGVGLQRDLRA